MKGSYSEQTEISKVLTMMEKDLFRTWAIPVSTFIAFPFSDKFVSCLALTLSDSDGFTVF